MRIATKLGRMSNGQRSVKRVRRGEKCADIRISDDGLAVAWVMGSEAVTKTNGRMIQTWTKSDLFVNGIRVQYEELALYDWRFYNDSRQLIFEAGPLRGGGNMFLYDIRKKHVIDRCTKRRKGVICPSWAQ